MANEVNNRTILAQRALETLNSILELEKSTYNKNMRLEFGFDNQINLKTQELQIITQPDFLNLNLDESFNNMLQKTWLEIQSCINSHAFTPAIIQMGSFLECLLLGMMRKYPHLANSAGCAPHDKSGKIKKFNDWKLSEMIDVSFEIGWIDHNVQKFSHILRDYRNLVHPILRMRNKMEPDYDTCKISIIVLEASCNNSIKWIKSQYKDTTSMN